MCTCIDDSIKGKHLIDEMKRTKMEVGDDSGATDDCRRDEISQTTSHPSKTDMEFQNLKKIQQQHRHNTVYTSGTHIVRDTTAKNNNNSNNIEYRKKCTTVEALCFEFWSAYLFGYIVPKHWEAPRAISANLSMWLSNPPFRRNTILLVTVIITL